MALENVSFSATLTATQSSALDLGTRSFPATLTQALSLLNGTGAGMVDLMFSDTATLAASANADLDLAGVLTDSFGTALTFARIKAVIITALAANTNNVRLTRPASAGVPLFLAASDGIDIRPGGFFAWGCTDATGVAVTATTADILNIANSSGTTGVTYSIIILGCSA